ncbi:hypothetical protein ES708_21113 [subsurface metagenome]
MNYKYHPRYQEEKEPYSREVVAKLYPEIEQEPIGSPNDRKGIDGWYQEESVQIKYDKVIPFSGNIYHEYREKFKGRPQEMWRDNEFHADWWLFVSQTKNGVLTIFIALSEMKLREKGKKMVAIPAEAPTSMGYIIPREELLQEVRKEVNGQLFQYEFTNDLLDQFREALPLFCRRCGEPVYLEEREAGKRYVDAITLKPHALTCRREGPSEVDVTNKKVKTLIEDRIVRHKKRGVVLRGPDGRVIDWLWCLSTWDKLGRPVVYAGPGDPFYDLSLYMYPERLSPQKLQGIAAWLEEHSGERQQ